MQSTLKKVLIGSAIALPLLTLQSFHIYKNAVHGNPSSSNQKQAGPANAAMADRTGSPLSGNRDCSSCHTTAGDYTNVLTSVMIKNSSDEVITSYTPGETLTVKVTVTADGSPAGYGSQLTILDGADKMAGSFIAAQTTETQISSIDDVQYLEHDGRSATGVFTATYTAPSEGTGTVTVYSAGLAANGSGSSGDNASPTVTVSLTENEVDEPTGLMENEFSQSLAAYPNPSNGTFNIDLGKEYSNISTKLCNAAGEVISTDTYNNLNNLNMTIDQASGVYYLIIETGDKSGSVRLIKD